jgi:HK97 family phage portal protein
MVFSFKKRGAAEMSEAETPATETKASAAGPVIAFQTSGRVAWMPRDAVSLIKGGFTSNPVGFRCVKLIAEAAAALPVLLQEDGKRFETHPVLDLLSRPNGGQGRAAFLEAVFCQLLLSGNSYIEAVSGEDGVPYELHVLRSDRVRLVPGADGWPVAYEYSVGAKKHVFKVGEGTGPICHIRSFHPLDDHYGLSPMQSAATAIDVHNSASRWSKSLLDNAARPSGAIVYKGGDGQSTLSNDQYDRLLGEMESHHQGARNAGRPMLLEGGLDWKPMGFSPSDMEFQKTKDAAAREIALAFGVPPMLLGIPGDATYSNYQEAHRAFYRLTIVPLAQRVLAAVSDWVNGFSGGAATLRPDLDQLPALAGEREALWARIGEADFLSDAEKRVLLGLPALADENEE